MLNILIRFELGLHDRLEYLTLAVGNAKSHPISVGGRHESAIAFLTELEEKLDVAQVQLEIYNTLLPHINDAGETGEKVKVLSKRLLTMSEVSESFSAEHGIMATPSVVPIVCRPLRSVDDQATLSACVRAP